MTQSGQMGGIGGPGMVQDANIGSRRKTAQHALLTN